MKIWNLLNHVSTFLVVNWHACSLPKLAERYKKNTLTKYKIFNFVIVISLFCSGISGQDKTEKPEKSEPVIPTEKAESIIDKKLDPIYFAANFDEIRNKRIPTFRKRKGEIPEQIWKVKTNGVVTAPPILFESKLLIGTSTGLFNYLDFKTGLPDKKACSAKGILVWIDVQNNQRATGMTWVGTVVSFAKDWEHFMVTNYSAYKSKNVPPLGALVWLSGSIITRRDNFPIMIDSKEDKVISQPSRTWSNGEATAPLIFTGNNFWVATSKGELLSFDVGLTTVLSTIRLEKSYATALAGEGNLLFALTADKELIAYDALTNTLKWKIKVAGQGVNSLALEKNRLYVNAGSFYVINVDDGSILLERKSISYEGFMRTKPLITKELIFSCDSEGVMFIYEKNDLKFRQAIPFEEDVMVNFYYLDKVLYVPTIAGHLYAIDVSFYTATNY